jgi:hypothetical protein
MAYSRRQQPDPLDREIFERGRAAVKDNDQPIDSDEGLEALLRRELIEIAYSNGLRDPEALCDFLLTTILPDDRCAEQV